MLAMRPAIEGEVDQVATVGRQVTAVFVDPAAQPLPEGELVRAAVPQDGADLLGRPAPDHDRPPRFPRQDHVQTRSGSSFRGALFSAVCWCVQGVVRFSRLVGRLFRSSSRAFVGRSSSCRGKCDRRLARGIHSCSRFAHNPSIRLRQTSLCSQRSPQSLGAKPSQKPALQNCTTWGGVASLVGIAARLGK
jgi:hypothetical protein